METMEQAVLSAEKALRSVPSASPERATNARPNARATRSFPEPFVPSADDAPRSAAMRRLWVRMAAIYGYRWTSAYGERCDDDSGVLTTAGDTWQRGLTGVTERGMATGLQACLTSADPWPPTLPAFRAQCLGVPTLAAVKLDLRRNGTVRAPFTSKTWSFIDGYAYMHATVEQADRMLRDAYNLARDDVMNGGTLPTPAPGIDAPAPAEHQPADPATAKAHLDQIAALLNVPAPEVAP